MKDEKVYIAQILESIKKIKSFTSGLEINLEIVWNTILLDLPPLEEKLKNEA